MFSALAVDKSCGVGRNVWCFRVGGVVVWGGWCGVFFVRKFGGVMLFHYIRVSKR